MYISLDLLDTSIVGNQPPATGSIGTEGLARNQDLGTIEIKLIPMVAFSLFYPFTPRWITSKLKC